MPLMQQYLLDLVAPPIVTCAWWLFSLGTASLFQGGRVSERTKGWLRRGLIFVLLGTYLVMFGGTTYLHFTR
jgi:hypothetical protein